MHSLFINHRDTNVVVELSVCVFVFVCVNFIKHNTIVSDMWYASVSVSELHAVWWLVEAKFGLVVLGNEMSIQVTLLIDFYVVFVH